MKPFAAGDLIDDQYDVVDYLGGGASAEVYRVRNLADDLEYALKLYHRGDVQEVRRELRPLRRFEHPNIVNAHWGGQLANGTWYVALDYVTGESLRSRLSGGPFEISQVRDVGAQLLEALTAIHPNEKRLASLDRKKDRSAEEYDEWRELKETGIVHRDVKPENLIIGDDGTVVLCDFGISSRAGTQRGTVSYTPHYLPPGAERIPFGEWEPDVDRYAAAVTLFEALVGSYCYPDESEDMRAELEDASAPEELIEFFECACAAEREHRFETTADMIGTWNVIDWEDEAEPRAAVRRNEPPAAELSDDQVRALILDLVQANGPIVCRDLYRLFASATMSHPTRRLNKLIYGMLANPKVPLRQLEPLGGGQQDKTVFIAGG